VAFYRVTRFPTADRTANLSFLAAFSSPERSIDARWRIVAGTVCIKQNASPSMLRRVSNPSSNH
jgi:hypothetical protein